MKQMILLLLIIFMTTGCGGESNIKSKIIVGLDDEFEPLGFRDENGKLIGFDVDLATEAARRLGVEIEFKPIDWYNKKEEITSGNIDMIWNGLDITEERKQYMIFSKPYMEDRQIILLKKESDLEFHSEYDLENKIVGVQAGSTSDDYIEQKKELRAVIKQYKTYGKFQDMVKALKNNKIEVIVCDEIIARYAMNIYPNELKIVNVKIGDITETGIGFSKDNPELRDEIQKVFDEMVKDGTARKISMKWFQADLIKSGR